MKYEIIFGDYEFASSTSEIAVRSGYGDILEMSLIAPIVIPDEWSVIAMRRIIKEPKRWTWEDKKAGRLPEVGSIVSSVAYGYTCSVVAIDSNSRHIWCQFPDQSVGSCMIFEINPIETPAEKAQREEDEFVDALVSEYNKMPSSISFKAGIRAAYRKLKGVSDE